jgi:hypothetical protein
MKRRMHGQQYNGKNEMVVEICRIFKKNDNRR